MVVRHNVRRKQHAKSILGLHDTTRGLLTHCENQSLERPSCPQTPQESRWLWARPRLRCLRWGWVIGALKVSSPLTASSLVVDVVDPASAPSSSVLADASANNRSVPSTTDLRAWSSIILWTTFPCNVSFSSSSEAFYVLVRLMP